MPTTIYDSSLITKRRQVKAESGNFINRIQPTVGQPTTGYAPALGIWDQSVINDVNNGQMKYYRKGTGGLTTVDNGCPCPPATTSPILPDVPGPVRDIVLEYGSVIVTWLAPIIGGTPTSYTVSAVPIQPTLLSTVTITGVLTTSYTFATLVLFPGAEYQISVIGVNAGGDGLPPTSPLPSIFAPFTAPTIESVLRNGEYDELVISVDYQTSPNFPLTADTDVYVLMYINGGSSPSTPSYTSNIIDATHVIVTVTGLSPQNQYTFTVQLAVGNDVSSISNPSTAINPTIPPPPAVIEPAIRSATAATITFVEYDGFIATGGTLYDSSGAVVGNATSSGAPPGLQRLEVSGLVSGTAYNNSYIIVSNSLYTSSQSNLFTLLYTAPIITPPPTTTETTVTITYFSSFELGTTLTATLYYAVNDTVFRTVTNASSTQMIVTGLTPGTPYTDLYLKLSNSSGISLPSASFGFTTTNFPAPILLASPNTTTNITTTGVTINYNNYTFDGSPPTTGTLYDSSGNVITTTTLSVTSTQMTVSGLTQGTTYTNTYIRLIDGTYTSLPSATFSFTTLFPAPILLASPNTTTNITTTGVTINYNNYTLDGSPPSSGTLYDASGVIGTYSTSSTQMLVDNLAEGTPYNNCYITLSNGSGTTANSAPFSFTTEFPAPTLLASPNTTTNITATSVTINYDNYTAFGSSPITGSLYDSNGFIGSAVSTSSTQMIMDNLSPGVSYSVFIILSNSDYSYNSDQSATFSFTTFIAAPVVTTRTNITATGVTINYDNYDGFGFIPPTSGTLYTSNGVVITTTLSVTSTQMTVTGLTPGTTYTDTYITLSDGTQTSFRSNSVPSFTTFYPAPILLENTTTDITTTSVTINYVRYTAFGSSPISGTLYNATGDPIVTTVSEISDTQMTVTGLTSATSYSDYSITLIGGSGTSLRSAPFSFSTSTPAPILLASPNTTTNITTTSVTINYNNYTAFGSSPIYGRLYNSNNDIISTASVTSTQMTAPDLIPGTTYTNTYIQLTDGTYDSLSSATFSFTTLSPAPILTPVPTTTETTVTIYYNNYDAYFTPTSGTVYINGAVYTTVTPPNISSTQMTVTGLTPGITYNSWSIQLTDGTNTSAISATFTFTTTLYPAPTLLASPNTTTNITATGVTINYDNYTAFGSSPITGSLYDSNGFIGSAVSTSSTQMIMDNLSPGVSYTNIFIRLSDGIYTSLPSATFSFTTFTIAPVVTTRTNITMTGVTINYINYAGFQLAPTSGTLYTSNGVVITTTLSVTSTQMTVTGLTPETTYTNTYITLSDGTYTSLRSNSVPSFTTLSPPAPTVTSTNTTNTSVTIIYNDYGSIQVNNGTLYDSSGNVIAAVAASSTEMTVTNLDTQALYSCSITLTDGTFTSGPSALFPFITTANPPPINIYTTPYATEAVINYTTYSAFTPDIGRLYDSAGNPLTDFIPADPDVMLVSDLLSNTTYICRISLGADGITSAISATFQFTTL